VSIHTPDSPLPSQGAAAVRGPGIRHSRSLTKRDAKLREAAAGWLFVLPQTLGFVLMVLVPTVLVVLYSLENRNLLFGTRSFAGLRNYLDLAEDPLFYKTLGNTLIFSLGAVPLNIVFSLFVAVFLADRFRGAGFLRAAIFTPVVTSAVAWSIVWKFLLQGGDAGVINQILGVFGIAGPNWLREPVWAMTSVVVTRVIKNLGMNVLILTGAMLNIPSEVLEAARIDGAKRWRLFRSVKLPLLSPTLLMVMILTVIGSLKVFDSIKLMTNGGPENSTMVLVYYIYFQGFQLFKTGYASAASVVLFLLILGLTLVQWKLRAKISWQEGD
jgi:multiple sugar transport system permease protein